MADKTAERQPAQLPNDMNMAASQLSAMVDDELQDIESDLVLRRLSRDQEVRDRWERYHLISNALQDHLPAMIDTGFAARIRQAIEADPLPLPIVKPLPTWYKPVTGFALAASVVLMALFGLKLTQTDTLQSTSQFALSAMPGFTTPAPAAFLPTQTVASSQRTDSTSAPVESRLGSYLVNHNGYASMNSMHGMLPHVRMVGYQTDR